MADSGPLMKKRRIRKPILTADEKKRRKRERARKEQKTRVMLGNQHERWCTFKKENGLITDRAVAKFLLDKEQPMSGFEEVSTSGGESSQQSQKKKLSMQYASCPSPEYKNCSIRGLPITLPFRICFDIQNTYIEVGTFIILPFQVSGLSCKVFDFTHTVETTTAEESIKVECNYDSEETLSNSSEYDNVRVSSSVESNIHIKSEPEENDDTINIQEELKEFQQGGKSSMQDDSIQIHVSMNHIEHHSENIKQEKSHPQTLLDSIEASNLSSTFRKRRKAKNEEDDELVEIQKPKLVKLDEDTKDGIEDSLRKSSRMQSVGYRPDYQNLENKFDNVLRYLEGDDSEDSLLDKSDLNEDNNEAADEKVMHDNDPDYDPDETSEGIPSASLSKRNINNDNDSDIADESDFKDDDSPCIKTQATERKTKGKPKPQMKRIKVRLEDHQDKYKIEAFDSIARKDRGKSESERSVTVYSCISCNNYTSESIEGMESHLEKHVNGELNCKDCDFSASTIWEVSLHWTQMHYEDCQICPECGMKVRQDRFKYHLGKAHNKPQYSCKYCPDDPMAKFATNEKLIRHIKESHKDVCYACTSCRKMYVKEDNLNAHIKRCSGKDGSINQCEKCGKNFSSESCLLSHKQRVHLKVRKHFCSECPFVAKSSTGLKNHRLVHEGVHPHQCDKCGFTCVQGYQLTSHMRTHTGEKPYKCTQCKYTAAWNVQLKDHVKVHSMNMSVSCKKCDIVFKNEKTLRVHVKKEKCSL